MTPQEKARKIAELRTVVRNRMDEIFAALSEFHSLASRDESRRARLVLDKIDEAEILLKSDIHATR